MPMSRRSLRSMYARNSGSNQRLFQPRLSRGIGTRSILQHSPLLPNQLKNLQWRYDIFKGQKFWKLRNHLHKGRKVHLLCRTRETLFYPRTLPVWQDLCEDMQMHQWKIYLCGMKET